MRGLLPCALTVSLVLPFEGVSHAGTCAAYAVPPYPSASGVTGKGVFRCAERHAGMTVTVCVDLLEVTPESVAWAPWDCVTTTAAAESDHVSAGVSVQVPLSSFVVVRTTAAGRNDSGDMGHAESPPTVWFNCGCPV